MFSLHFMPRRGIVIIMGKLLERKESNSLNKNKAAGRGMTNTERLPEINSLNAIKASVSGSANIKKISDNELVFLDIWPEILNSTSESIFHTLKGYIKIIRTKSAIYLKCNVNNIPPGNNLALWLIYKNNNNMMDFNSSNLFNAVNKGSVVCVNSTGTSTGTSTSAGTSTGTSTGTGTGTGTGTINTMIDYEPLYAFIVNMNEKIPQTKYDNCNYEILMHAALDNITMETAFCALNKALCINSGAGADSVIKNDKNRNEYIPIIQSERNRDEYLPTIQNNKVRNENMPVIQNDRSKSVVPTDNNIPSESSEPIKSSNNSCEYMKSQKINNLRQEPDEQRKTMCEGCSSCKLQEGSCMNVENCLEIFLNACFPVIEPFGAKRKDYRWWEVKSPAKLLYIYSLLGIHTGLLYNSATTRAHGFFGHIVAGIYFDRNRKKIHPVFGIPSKAVLDGGVSPFGECARWVETVSEKYGRGYGYWLVFLK